MLPTAKESVTTISHVLHAVFLLNAIQKDGSDGKAQLKAV